MRLCNRKVNQPLSREKIACFYKHSYNPSKKTLETLSLWVRKCQNNDFLVTGLKTVNHAYEKAKKKCVKEPADALNTRLCRLKIK